MKHASNTSTEVKEKAKGLWTHIKRICTQPIKSSDEAAARKKEVLKDIYVCLAIIGGPFAIMIVLGVIFRILRITAPEFIVSILSGVTCVGCLGATLFFIILININRAAKKFQNIECSNCKKRITYGDGVEYIVLREWEKKTTSYNEKTNQATVTQDQYVEVGVTVTCPDCGTVGKFATEFIAERWVNGNCRVAYEIPELLERYFEDVKPIPLGIYKKKKKDTE